MKTVLLTDFVVDKASNKITVKKEFSAPLSLVWAAWTEVKHLEKWWAPKPYRAVTKSMSFKPGGYWLYAMTGPEGDAQFCRFEYVNIDNQKNFTALNSFCTSEAVVTNEIAQHTWNTGFAEHNGGTLVTIVLSFNKLTDLEKIIELGFKEGFLMAMGNLEEELQKIV